MESTEFNAREKLRRLAEWMDWNVRETRPGIFIADVPDGSIYALGYGLKIGLSYFDPYTDNAFCESDRRLLLDRVRELELELRFVRELCDLMAVPPGQYGDFDLIAATPAQVADAVIAMLDAQEKP